MLAVPDERRGPRLSARPTRRPVRAGIAAAAVVAAGVAGLVTLPGCGGSQPSPVASGGTGTSRAVNGAKGAGSVLEGAGTGGATASGGATSVGPGDSGRTVMLHVGQSLDVNLEATPSTRWSAPHTDTPSVLATVSSGADPGTGSATGVFRGVAAGAARVTAGQSPRCSPGHACPTFVRLWEVTVDVVG